MNGLEPSTFSLGTSVSAFENRFLFTGIGMTVAMFAIVDSTESRSANESPPRREVEAGWWFLLACGVESTAFSSASSGDGALSSGADAGSADREGGEATESRNGASRGSVLPGDDALVRHVVVGPAIDGEGVLALGHAE